MDLRAEPLATAEFLAVDVETNGRAGDLCEMTEVGAVLVGGGELHDRFESLVSVERPLSRGIERFTGITQDRKSTRLNSSHVKISYAVFCLKKKKNIKQ